MSQGASGGAGQGAGNNRFVKFTRPAAQRIAEAVRKVEGGNRDQPPFGFEHPQVASVAKVFRVCTFTGSWSINATKTLIFKNQTSTPNTAAAVNLFCGLDVGTVACDVSVAKDGTAWYLLQPNLTQQPGYSGSGTQVLAIQNGSLAWIGTTTC
jgi:hypothetical protein